MEQVQIVALQSMITSMIKVTTLWIRVPKALNQLRWASQKPPKAAPNPTQAQVGQPVG
jgi:hypothetical protein